MLHGSTVSILQQEFFIWGERKAVIILVDFCHKLHNAKKTNKAFDTDQSCMSSFQWFIVIVKIIQH